MMLNHHFRIGLNSFYQINSEVAQVVYQDIIQFVIPQGITLDLYSGIGIIAILVAQKSSQVYGVEINRSAFADAQYNSKFNQLKNVEFFCQDVKKFLQNWNGKHKIDTLILDPSRLGIEKVVIDLILQKIKPQRIIYLACNPGKQAANFKDLQVAYDLKFAKIYDMFPQTYHIESLIVLERKEQKKMVS